VLRVKRTTLTLHHGARVARVPRVHLFSPTMPSFSPAKKTTHENPLEEFHFLLKTFETAILDARNHHIQALLAADQKQQQHSPLNTKAAGVRAFFSRHVAKVVAAEREHPIIVTEENKSMPKTQQQQQSSSLEPPVLLIPFPNASLSNGTMIESLRRMAELVVMGENYTTHAETRVQRQFQKAQQEWKQGRDQIFDNEEDDAIDNNNDNNNSTADDNDDHEENERKQEYLQLFDIFFERNVLETMIQLLTGETFKMNRSEMEARLENCKAANEQQTTAKTIGADMQPSNNETVTDVDNDTKETVEQPTAEATTRELYAQHFPNDPILLPPVEIATQALQSISILIQNVSRATSLYMILSNNRINDLIHLPLHLYAKLCQPPEHAELATHFITFSKSLAIRMNAQTLQFFLTYPAEAQSGTASSSYFSTTTTTTQTTTATTQTTDYDQQVDSSFNELESLGVEFPLYERSLEFCAAHQDSFVRITAMNICLNTLRLTTAQDNDHDTNVESATMVAPNGALHAAQALPFRERLAIAQFACVPSRVERLIAPICTSLAEKWSRLEEVMRDTQTTLTNTTLQAREKLARLFQDRTADLQDEFLLLEDVFRVGLTVLNEQLIEMLFATFVYPLLLQPILLYHQQFLQMTASMSDYTLDIHPLGGDARDFASVQQSLNHVLAPAKTSLLSLAAMFSFISNGPLRKLLYTALLHPLSPDSASWPTLRSKLEVATVGENGQQCIRLDKQALCDDERSTYAFGTTPGNRRVSRAKVDISLVVDGGEACVFVLTPALAEVLEYDGNDPAFITRTRPNPYRHALVSFLKYPLDVRELAVYVFDAAVTALEDKFLTSEIMFGTDLKTFADNIPVDEPTMDSKSAPLDTDRDMGIGTHDSRTSIASKPGHVASDFTKEAVQALCQCVLSASKFGTSCNGWKLSYNETAAHALLICIRAHPKALMIAVETMDHLLKMTASFIASACSSIVVPIGGSNIQLTGAPSVNDEDHDEKISAMLMNMVFYDSTGFTGPSGTTSAMDEFVHFEQPGYAAREYLLSISFQSDFDSLCTSFGRHIIEGTDAIAETLAEKDEIELNRVATRALFQTDSFVTILKNISSSEGHTFKDGPCNGIVFNLEGRVLVQMEDTHNAKVWRHIFAPISSTTREFLFTAEQNTPRVNGSCFEGQLILPCVCEVAETFASLFVDGDSGVVAEGVTWQSLILSIIDGFFIVALPTSDESSAGQGVVISSFPAEQLTIRADDISAETVARRLLLTHSSYDPLPPPLFLFETAPEYEKLGPLVRSKAFVSSLVVWFEHQEAADLAFTILSSLIFEAKIKRGQRIVRFLQKISS
jgi:hypothetical protein